MRLQTNQGIIPFLYFPSGAVRSLGVGPIRGAVSLKNRKLLLDLKKEAETLFLPTGLQLRLAASLLLPHLVSEPHEPLL